MTNPKWNNDLPITHHGRRGVQVPLDQALANPQTVMNTTPKTYLPKPDNEVGPQKK